MTSHQDVLHALVLEAAQQCQQAVLVHGSARQVQATCHGQRTFVIDRVQLAVGGSSHATPRGRGGGTQHGIELAATAECFHRVGFYFTTVPLAYDTSHAVDGTALSGLQGVQRNVALGRELLQLRACLPGEERGDRFVGLR